MSRKRPQRIIVAKKFCNKLSSVIDLLKELGDHPEEVGTFQRIYNYYKDLVDSYDQLQRPFTVVYQMYGKKFKELTDEERRNYLAFLARNRRAEKRSRQDSK